MGPGHGIDARAGAETGGRAERELNHPERPPLQPPSDKFVPGPARPGLPVRGPVALGPQTQPLLPSTCFCCDRSGTRLARGGPFSLCPPLPA